MNETGLGQRCDEAMVILSKGTESLKLATLLVSIEGVNGFQKYLGCQSGMTWYLIKIGANGRGKRGKNNSRIWDHRIENTGCSNYW
jgi:hypothetical protein